MSVLARVLSGVSAGMLIAVGGSVYLACDNKYVGAVLFSVALLCICFRGYSLFTGKVGFMAEKHGKREWSVLLLGLLGNAIAAIGLGFAIRFALPQLGDKAADICIAKLAQDTLSALIRALFCGVLMYMAVGIYRDGKSVLGILFCIPVFILSGFEHSVADMFYFGASAIINARSLLYLFLIVVGNAAGALFAAFLEKFGRERTEK